MSNSNVCNPYASNPLLKGVRTQYDIDAMNVYNAIAQSQNYGPNPGPAPVGQGCVCPYGYANLGSAYLMSGGNGSANLTNFSQPLNMQHNVENYTAPKYRGAPARPFRNF